MNFLLAEAITKMPRYSKIQLSEGWQAAERGGVWYLQKQRSDGAWQDVSGPFRQRGSAVKRYDRALLTARGAWVDTHTPCEHPHEWRFRPYPGIATFTQCRLCGQDFGKI